MVSKNYQWNKAIQFKDVVWKGMLVFIKQFIQNLKNDVITMIVTARIHREKIARCLKKRKLDLNTSGLDSPSDKKLRR